MTTKQKSKSSGIDPQIIFKNWISHHTEEENKTFFGQHYEVVQKMMACRDPKKLGYHKYQCPDHPEEIVVVPHTCKTRICTSCAKIQNDTWSEEMKARMPKTNYFHITLTMPEEFREFFGKEDKDWERKSELYFLAWKAIEGYFAGHNCITGCMIVLHTFGRAVNINPHLHIILFAGGLRKAEKEKTGYKYMSHEFIPKEYLQRAWKRNLLEYVLQNTPSLASHTEEVISLLREKNSSDSSISLKALQRIISIIRTNTPEDTWEKWEKVIINVDYYINIKKKGSEARESLNYIARYTKRLPIAKSRILEFNPETEEVTWVYQPHNENSPVTSILPTQGFIQRLLQHTPPKNFRIVRYFGIFATKTFSHFHPILEKMFPFDIPQHVPTWLERQIEYNGRNPLICPCCHQQMILTEKAYDSAGKLKIMALEREEIKKCDLFHLGGLCLNSEISSFFLVFEVFFFSVRKFLTLLCSFLIFREEILRIF